MENKPTTNEMMAPEQKESIFKKPWLQSLIGIVLVFVALGLFFVIRGQIDNVKIDNSTIQAPIITISDSASAPLNQVYVQDGDQVLPNMPLARVGTEILTSTVAGTVIDIKQDIGTVYSPSQPIVSIIQPSELRVVGEIEENKGLSKIAVGQPVTFTVDAFGGKKYYGVVDSIAPTSNASSVVFDISDEREEQIFDVKVRYDVSAYPELKNGMSAKMVVQVK